MAHFWPPLGTSSNLITSEEAATQRASQLHKIFNSLRLQQLLLNSLSSQSCGIHQALQSLQGDIGALEFLLTSPKTIPNKQLLLEYLRPSVQTFELNLELHGTLLNPVCKGKYFRFEVTLQSASVPIPHSEDFQVGAALYSAESRPQRLTVNMLGQPLLKGSVKAKLQFDEILQLHKASFRVMVNEVTSHFRNGWVFLVVSLDDTNKFLAKTGYAARPLIVEHLVSKAKEQICRRWRAKSKACDIQPDSVF